MTTAQSPLPTLKAQADEIAFNLKKAARGHQLKADPNGTLAAAIKRGSVTVGIVMDDKIVKLTIQTETIRNTDESSLSNFIVEQMRSEPPK